MSNSKFLFIGRHEARDAFHSLLSLREQKSALYVQAGGGLGKTRYLRWIIEEYKENPRWYFKPSGSAEDPLIDFYELRNQSVAGLRYSIIERLGWEYFSSFKESEEEMHEAQAQLITRAGGTDSASASAAFALHRRTDELFFKDFKNAISEIRKYVVLLFDTFEVAHHRTVGRWFLNEFLLRQETSGCFVVFAGRPPRPKLPVRVRPVVLSPWMEEETVEYLDKSFEATPYEFKKKEVHDIYVATEGHPLLVDMVVYMRNSNLAPLDELTNVPKATLEWALINRIAHSTQPEHVAILEMGCLKRRFDPRIFEIRQRGNPAYAKLAGYDALVYALQQEPAESKKGFSSITKYRPKDKVLTPHDEVQRMIAEHAFARQDFPGPRTPWKDLTEELYEEVVRGWYPQAIAQARSEEEKGVLVAECLGYELDRNFEEGIRLYQRQFEEAWKQNRFGFIELIWGEIADRLEDAKEGEKFAGQEYELCYAQAEWRWATNQFDAASELYRLIVDRYTSDPKAALRKLDALAALGHSLMRLGKYIEAQESFEQGLALAESLENKPWLSAFQQNTGQLLQTLNRWDEAEAWFRKAVKTAESGKRKETIALASVNLGRLQAVLGRYDEAILNCQKAVTLRRELLAHSNESELAESHYEPEKTGYLKVKEQPFAGYYSPEGQQTRLAYTHLRLGEAYRYSGPQNREKARQNYEKAIELLPEAMEYRYRCEVLQGLGSVFHENGVEARRVGDYMAAADLQSHAFDLMSEAITLCRKHGLERELPQALHRIAHIFFEIGELERLSDLQRASKLLSLLKRGNRFLLPEEDNYRDRLLESGEFTSLDTTAKVQRLFEVSSLEAERSSIQDYNTSLDSLVEACEIALQRGRAEDVRNYANLAHIPGHVFQQELFWALIDLTMADLDLVEGRSESALDQYTEKFPVVARSGGYGRHLLRNRLARFGEKLLALPADQGIKWCDTLIHEWTEQGLVNTHPYLISQMWEYRDALLG